MKADVVERVAAERAPEVGTDRVIGDVLLSVENVSLPSAASRRSRM